MNYVKKKYNEKKIMLYHFYALIPLLIYGFYKNGISLYLSGDISLEKSLMPLIYIIGFAFIMFILKKILKKDFNLKDFYFYASILFLPITYNYLLVFLLFTLFYFLSLTKINFPFNLMFLIVLYIILELTSNLTFLNEAQSIKNYSYTNLDFFIGKGESFMFTSSIFFSLISFIYLSLKPYFKSLIPLAFLVFYILETIIVGHYVSLEFTNVVGIFCAVYFLGAEFFSSPITKIKMCVYAFVIASLTVCFNVFIDYYLSVIISIYITQILSKFGILKNFTK